MRVRGLRGGWVGEGAGVSDFFIFFYYESKFVYLYFLAGGRGAGGSTRSP